VLGTAIDLVVSSGPCLPEQVALPDVRLLMLAEAEAEVTAAQLMVGTITEVFISWPAGTVFGQSPTGGTLVDVGSLVDLHVSKGPEMVLVPNVVGAPEEEARTTILDSRLTVGNITRQFHPTAEVGAVVNQNPTAGTEVEVSSAVNLVVSLGPETTTVSVPNVVALPEAQARTAIINTQLIVGEVTYRHDSATAGLVLEQNPTAGTEVEVSSAVDLVVSLGPENPPEATLKVDVIDDIHILVDNVYTYRVGETGRFRLTVVDGEARAYILVGASPEGQSFELTLNLDGSLTRGPMDFMWTEFPHESNPRAAELDKAWLYGIDPTTEGVRGVRFFLKVRTDNGDSILDQVEIPIRVH
ncbi:MAG: PASTA domain-containing protein, partial [Candidatus Paceibacterota bacterium]